MAERSLQRGAGGGENVDRLRSGNGVLAVEKEERYTGDAEFTSPVFLCFHLTLALAAFEVRPHLRAIEAVFRGNLDQRVDSANLPPLDEVRAKQAFHHCVFGVFTPGQRHE